MKVEAAIDSVNNKRVLGDKLELFFRKQLVMFKYAFAIDRTLIHMIVAGVMFGVLFFTDKAHYLAGYLAFYH